MKLFFICEPASPHAARWINQFANSGHEIHIMSEDPLSTSICKDLKCGNVFLPAETEVPPGVHLTITGVLDYENFVGLYAHLLEAIKPDLIHTLGMYVNSTNRILITGKLREKFRFLRDIPWIYSSWGMDLDWFAKKPENTTYIKESISQLDYYISECDRDINYIRELGFTGEILGKIPAFGGTTWSMEDLPPLSERKNILIKARDISDGDQIGRAMKIFPALLANKDALSKYNIIGMQAGDQFKEAALRLESAYGIKIHCPERLPKQSDILDLYKYARAWIALTTNDGLPSSLVEAMSLGAIPLHSDLSSMREWISHGKNGLLVDLENTIELNSCLRKALIDDEFCRNAMEGNLEYVKQNWTDDVVKPKALNFYNKALKN